MSKKISKLLQESEGVLESLSQPKRNLIVFLKEVLENRGREPAETRPPRRPPDREGGECGQ